MAPPKHEKRSPLEDPPAASSSSEDEEVEKVVEEEQNSDPKAPHSSDDDEEEDESEDELEESEPKKNALKKPSSSAKSDPKTPSNAKKRPFESHKYSKQQKKKKQTKVDDEGGKDAENSEKKNMFFQRIWSDEDEIVILKGMVESKKIGVDALSDLKEFLESIKKSLQVKEVRQEQLKTKIQRLRKKFMNTSKKAKGDEDLVLSKPHEQLSYTLMKEIWGGESSVVVTNDGKDHNDDSVVVANVKRSSSLRKSQNVIGNPVRTKNHGISMMKLDESNESLHSCVPESEKGALEQKWRRLIADELKLYLRRVELVREQTIAIINAGK